MKLHSVFEDGEAYDNPFHAMLDHGADWATVGMSVEEMTAAAVQLGGDTLGTKAPRTLSLFAAEFITRQSQSAPQGEQ